MDEAVLQVLLKVLEDLRFRHRRVNPIHWKVGI